MQTCSADVVNVRRLNLHSECWRAACSTTSAGVRPRWQAVRGAIVGALVKPTHAAGAANLLTDIEPDDMFTWVSISGWIRSELWSHRASIVESGTAGLRRVAVVGTAFAVHLHLVHHAMRAGRLRLPATRWQRVPRCRILVKFRGPHTAGHTGSRVLRWRPSHHRQPLKLRMKSAATCLSLGQQDSGGRSVRMTSRSLSKGKPFIAQTWNWKRRFANYSSRPPLRQTQPCVSASGFGGKGGIEWKP